MKYNYTDELDYKNWNSNLDNASKFYCNLHFTKKLDVQHINGLVSTRSEA